MQQEPEKTHGTLYGYAGQGCRCEQCREAARNYNRVYRATDNGREASRRSARRNNFIRQKALEWMRRERPDVIAIFESDWKEIVDDEKVNG